MRTTEETLKVIAMDVHRRTDSCEDCPVIRLIAEDAAEKVEEFVHEERLGMEETGFYLRLINGMVDSADAETAVWGLITMFEEAGESEDETDEFFRYLHGCEDVTQGAYDDFLEHFFAQDFIDNFFISKEIDSFREEPKRRLN